jgi:hypothetical protein
MPKAKDMLFLHTSSRGLSYLPLLILSLSLSLSLSVWSVVALVIATIDYHSQFCCSTLLCFYVDLCLIA